MLGIKVFTICIITLSFQIFNAQQVQLSGQVKSSSNIENIHVLNKTKQLYTITNQSGSFKIIVSEGDTLLFSSIQHKPLKTPITRLMIASKNVLVDLEEHVNELDEVVVGKILTGDLTFDIQHIEGKKPINFYDLGIPGYTGKPSTQAERRLYEAGEFSPKQLHGALGMAFPLNPIINGISGRIKLLKKYVAIEEREELLYMVRNNFEEDFLVSNPLGKDQINDFFYFCSDDPNFIISCKDKTDFEVLNFLTMKYQEYKNNITGKD